MEVPHFHFRLYISDIYSIYIIYTVVNPPRKKIESWHEFLFLRRASCDPSIVPAGFGEGRQAPQERGGALWGRLCALWHVQQCSKGTETLCLSPVVPAVGREMALQTVGFSRAAEIRPTKYNNYLEYYR